LIPSAGTPRPQRFQAAGGFVAREWPCPSCPPPPPPAWQSGHIQTMAFCTDLLGDRPVAGEGP